jgi:predicted nuclease of restriction endonuclease-like RecB superfamily
MLPLDLLRTKIINKGKIITPLFCLPSSDNLLLAQKLITEFQFSNNKKETKGELQKRLFLYENSYNDYKLIRGLVILLERRCIFQINSLPISDNTTQNFVTQLPSSFLIRKALFEESSKCGLSLDQRQRYKIFQNVASKLGMDIEYIEKLMWLDQEDYLILKSFNSIEPINLLGIYNLSILQTLLFNSVNFEFSVEGGTNWKNVLRTIKRFGLMYNLQKINHKLETSFPKKSYFNKNTLNYFKSYFNDNIICFIDGPLSIFKLTNKYGVLIAKVIPKIISSQTWNIKASIIKNSLSGRKLYEFNLSSDSDIYISNAMDDQIYNNYLSEDHNDNNLNFDSSVESKFATQFEKYQTGWKLIREPNPLILPNGKAFIPDFLFEKYDKRIYFEIIGFWTPQYLERKFKKIREIIKTITDNKYDILIAVNENNFVSEGTEIKRFFSNSILNDNNIIIYKKDLIPMKKILFYLKSIDKCIIDQNAETYKSIMISHITNLLNNNSEIINLEEISKIYGVSITSLLDIISNLTANINIENYIIQTPLLIYKRKLNKIKDEIGNIDNLIKIQRIFENNNIPVQYTTDILKCIGFEIIWKGMDSSNIIIKRKNS